MPDLSEENMQQFGITDLTKSIDALLYATVFVFEKKEGNIPLHIQRTAEFIRVKLGKPVNQFITDNNGSYQRMLQQDVGRRTSFRNFVWNKVNYKMESHGYTADPESEFWKYFKK